MNTEQELDLIMQSDTKDILRAFIKGLDGYHGIPVISLVRQKLGVKHWSDNIFSDLRLQNAMKHIFTNKGVHTRWTNGGSWSPEGYYNAVIYRCNICNEEFEVSTGNDEKKVISSKEKKRVKESHLLYHCIPFNKILDNSKSITQFLNNLDSFK